MGWGEPSRNIERMFLMAWEVGWFRQRVRKVEQAVELQYLGKARAEIDEAKAQAVRPVRTRLVSEPRGKA